MYAMRCMYVYTCVSKFMYLHVYVYISNVHNCMQHKRRGTFIYKYTHVYIYIYIGLYTYVYTYEHHMYINAWSAGGGEQTIVGGQEGDLYMHVYTDLYTYTYMYVYIYHMYIPIYHVYMTVWSTGAVDAWCRLGRWIVEREGANEDSAWIQCESEQGKEEIEYGMDLIQCGCCR